MNKIKLLFVCSSNLDRSPAAVEIFNNHEDCEAKSCGILPHSDIEISQKLIDWAEIIYCMEEEHKHFILSNFHAFDKKIVVLDISNEYLRNDPRLKKLIEERIAVRTIRNK